MFGKHPYKEIAMIMYTKEMVDMCSRIEHYLILYSESKTYGSHTYT